MHPKFLINQLYKYTRLQDSFNVNFLALIGGQPKILNLKEALQAYINYRKIVITNRTKFELKKAKERQEIVQGLLIALKNIDFVSSDTVFHPNDRIYINLVLENNGATGTASSIKASLTSLDPLVDIPVTIISYENIPAGGSSVSNDSYSIKILKDCPGDTIIPIVVNISSYESICWIDTIYITVHEPPEPENIFNAHELVTRIYPNPADNMLNIEISNTGKQELEIEIITVTGQVIYRKEYRNTGEHFTAQFDLSGFADGIYLVKIKQANSVYVGKVIRR